MSKFLKSLWAMFFNGPRIERNVFDYGKQATYRHNDAIDPKLFAKGVKKQFADDEEVNQIDIGAWAEWEDSPGDLHGSTFITVKSDSPLRLGERTGG